MTRFGSRNDYFSARNGWIQIEDLVQGLANSLERAQQRLASTGNDSLHMIIKDIRVDLPLEVHHDLAANVTWVRPPSIALQVDDRFSESHLSRIQFSLTHVLRDRSDGG